MSNIVKVYILFPFLFLFLKTVKIFSTLVGIIMAWPVCYAVQEVGKHFCVCQLLGSEPATMATVNDFA